MFLRDWTYDGTDPGLKLFTLANPMLPAVDASAPLVYEVGCCDTDFMERVEALGAYAYGIDWCERSPTHRHARRGSVLTTDFEQGDFDYVVGLSSVEHIGLGRYDHDPIDPYGDIKAVQRMKDHGDRVYFDVPYAPEGYHLLYHNKCRVYDDQSLLERFGPHTVLGYADHNVNTWIEKPITNNTSTRYPYWYVALLIERKDA